MNENKIMMKDLVEAGKKIVELYDELYGDKVRSMLVEKTLTMIGVNVSNDSSKCNNQTIRIPKFQKRVEEYCIKLDIFRYKYRNDTSIYHLSKCQITICSSLLIMMDIPISMKRLTELAQFNGMEFMIGLYNKKFNTKYTKKDISDELSNIIIDQLKKTQ